MKLIITLLSILLFASVLIPQEWQPSIYLITNPPIKMAQSIPEKSEVERECLPLPLFTTINPKDPNKELGQGELVNVTLNKGKKGDGTSDTCEYSMRLKSDHSVTWNALGFSHSEKQRIRDKEGIK